jgi:hypothetical protein
MVSRSLVHSRSSFSLSTRRRSAKERSRAASRDMVVGVEDRWARQVWRAAAAETSHHPRMEECFPLNAVAFCPSRLSTRVKSGRSELCARGRGREKAAFRPTVTNRLLFSSPLPQPILFHPMGLFWRFLNLLCELVRLYLLVTIATPWPELAPLVVLCVVLGGAIAAVIIILTCPRTQTPSRIRPHTANRAALAAPRHPPASRGSPYLYP